MGGARHAVRKEALGVIKNRVGQKRVCCRPLQRCQREAKTMNRMVCLGLAGLLMGLVLAVVGCSSNGNHAPQLVRADIVWDSWGPKVRVAFTVLDPDGDAVTSTMHWRDATASSFTGPGPHSTVHDYGSIEWCWAAAQAGLVLSMEDNRGGRTQCDLTTTGDRPPELASAKVAWNAQNYTVSVTFAVRDPDNEPLTSRLYWTFPRLGHVIEYQDFDGPGPHTASHQYSAAAFATAQAEGLLLQITDERGWKVDANLR
jgi:hypothetical protein